MDLLKAHVTEFQSIRDSNSFEVGDITCLVGKNEAGKTAILQAIYRLNPIIESEGNFDVTDDYPRADVEDYQHAVESGKREPAIVAQATFKLDDNDLEPIHAELGKKALIKSELTLKKGYTNQLDITIETNLKAALEHLIKNAELPPQIYSELNSVINPQEAITVLSDKEQTAEVTRLTNILSQIQQQGLVVYITTKFLKPRLPKFVYFNEYYQMRGHENIEALKQRVEQNKLKRSDHPLLGLVESARLNFDELLDPKRTQWLVNKLEGAGNHLGKKILKYWSQNKHLQTRFDVRPAQPKDPEDMRTGTNIWAGVYDSRHMVTTNLGTRSRGFVWFFSFLAWYSRLQRKNEKVILLFDEPGLFLHAKAQEDLLRYFELELKPHHQLIYSTHSPFMVDPKNFKRVRIVQDKGIDTLEELLPDEEGTKVLTDVLEASGDSLFPLQGALGYEIHQTLFVGPNSLVVEGVSDLLYIQTISATLQKKGHTGLSPEWTITPVGGADKVPTFIALLGAQKGLNIATLIDIQKKDHQTIENLYKKKLLKKTHVFTFADFTNQHEADIEDMFEANFYKTLVNEEFSKELLAPIKLGDLNNKILRIIVRFEDHFKKYPLKGNAEFNHYRPARYFSENIGSLESKISDKTLERFKAAFDKLNALI